MDRRLLMIALIAVLGTAFVVPVVSDDSSAATEKQGRMSMAYISSGETTVTERLTMEWNALYMLPGSDNQLAMEAYILDPRNSAPIEGDDRDLISRSEPGTPILVYAKAGYGYMERIWTPDRVELTPRLDPYSIDVDAEAGDIVKIRIIEAGGNSSGYINFIRFVKDGPEHSTDDRSVGDAYITEMKEGESLSMTVVWMDSEDFYVDITYSIDVSAPNGSATLFATVCIAIAAMVLILMIAAAMKPKWAE